MPQIGICSAQTKAYEYATSFFMTVNTNSERESLFQVHKCWHYFFPDYQITWWGHLLMFIIVYQPNPMDPIIAIVLRSTWIEDHLDLPLCIHIYYPAQSPTKTVGRKHKEGVDGECPPPHRMGDRRDVEGKLGEKERNDIGKGMWEKDRTPPNLAPTLAAPSPSPLLPCRVHLPESPSRVPPPRVTPYSTSAPQWW